MLNARSTTFALALLTATACTDRSTPLSTAPVDSPFTSLAESNSSLQRYVAIGTSVSMGWQSDGATAATQYDSWPAQLARMAGATMDQPYIDGTGCKAPLAAPLGSGRRISGEAAGAPDATLSCAPLKPGIDLPTRNVAIAGATTLTALNSTPQTITGVFNAQLYARILPPNTTQLQAAMAQKPRVVSVELGANEVLGARSGVAIPGVTIFPTASWVPLYDALVGEVVNKTPRVVLVGLIQDAATFPGFRRGAEIFADAATLLAAFNVMVAPDCDASPNLIFVPVRVPTAIAIGLSNRSNALPPFVFSCADGGTGVQDFVLTPSEVAVVNGTLVAMTAHIRATASQRNVAYFELEALYGQAGLKPPFSSVQLMTSLQPYGPLISLDGIHPSAAGHAVLAQAAARALNLQYRMRIPDASPTIAARY